MADTEAADEARRKRSAEQALKSGETKSPRKSPDKSLYPWRNITALGDISFDPAVMRTLTLKANHLADLKQAKHNILVRHDCPNFPDGLWNDILADRFIDLDRVFSGYYSLDLDYRHTQTVGDIDITLNTGNTSSKPSKLVCNHGDWAIAFATTKAAVHFAYPHCTREFAEYEKFIIGQFAAVGDFSQTRVVNLNKAKSDSVSPVPMNSPSSISTNLATSSHTMSSSVPAPAASDRQLPNASVPVHTTPTFKSADGGMLVNAPPNLAGFATSASIATSDIKQKPVEA